MQQKKNIQYLKNFKIIFGTKTNLRKMGVTDEISPTFTIKPRLREEEDGNLLIMLCELESNPVPGITWFKDSKMVVEDDRIKIHMEEIGVNKYKVHLKIIDVVPSDGGHYSVHAMNHVGDVTASLKLAFTRK